MRVAHLCKALEIFVALSKCHSFGTFWRRFTGSHSSKFSYRMSLHKCSSTRYLTELSYLAQKSQRCCFRRLIQNYFTRSHRPSLCNYMCCWTRYTLCIAFCLTGTTHGHAMIVVRRQPFETSASCPSAYSNVFELISSSNSDAVLSFFSFAVKH